MKRKGAWGALMVAAMWGCEVTPAEPDGMSPTAAAYLEYALDVMEAQSLLRYEIDWPAFRSATFEEAGNARTGADTYPAIVSALERLGDGHSFFRPPGGGGTTPPGQPEPSALLVEPGTGYLEVPAFSGGGAAADDLATRYHRLIEDVDGLGACRWVVDLRGNTGGNMWPMLAGVGPVLGEGTAGFFVDADDAVTTWAYEGGVATLEGIPFATASPPHPAPDPPPPVAVLTDPATASSGEAVTVAFAGRDDTRSFGEATFGVSTANAGFALPDGAVLFLTVARTADRTGRVYGEEVVPDSIVPGEKSGDRTTDAALDAALAWLEDFPCA